MADTYAEGQTFRTSGTTVLGSGFHELERQALVPANDVVDRPGWLGGQFDPGDPLDERCQDGLSFEAGEALPCARVRAVTGAELTGGVATDIEYVGIVPLAL